MTRPLPLQLCRSSFIHHTLYSRDPPRARTFYRELLGWTIGDDGVCGYGGRDIATITQSVAPPNVPSYWLPFFGVADIDTAVAQARALGAQLRRHTPGREAILVDPRGAAVGIRTGSEADSAFAWNELLTDKPEAAASFYAALGNLAVELLALPVGDYRILCSAARQVAGVMRHPANLHPHWQSYLAVDDVDLTTAQALKLGATLCFAPSDQPNFGRWSAVNDPVGAGLCFLRRF